MTANVLHPGVVATDFGREDSRRWMRLMLPVVRLFMKSPEKGAATSVHLASSPKVEGVSGRYFVDSQAKKSSPRSYDEDIAAHGSGRSAPSSSASDTTGTTTHDAKEQA